MEAMPDPFKLGDVVQRRTGGLDMAVVEASSEDVRCIWFIQERQGFEERTFASVDLKPVRTRSQTRRVPYEVGDWVVFKLGSMPMLVTHMSANEVSCSWYVQSTGEDQKRTFSPSLLDFSHSGEPADEDDLEPGLNSEGWND